MMLKPAAPVRSSSAFAAAAQTLSARMMFTARRWKNGRRGLVAGPHATLVRQLRREGYAVLPGYYDADRCDRLIAEIDRVTEAQPDAVQRDKLDSDRRVFGIEHASLLAAEFHRDAFLQAVGEAYYGNRLVNFSTLAGRLCLKPGNAGSGQGWHRDAFHFQFKAMIYLTDVSAENGAFQLLSRSHRPLYVMRDMLQGRLAPPPDSRIADAQAERLISAAPARLQTFAASRGTVILFDSSTIHRGSPIRSGIRYALTNYYFEPKQITSARFEQFAPFAQPLAD